MSVKQLTEWVPALPFGGRLLVLRHNLGLTVEEMADLTGQKSPTWSSWERGAKPRDLIAVVEAIHDATGVRREWLLWGGEPGDGPPPGVTRESSWDNSWAA